MADVFAGTVFFDMNRPWASRAGMVRLGLSPLGASAVLAGIAFPDASPLLVVAADTGFFDGTGLGRCFAGSDAQAGSIGSTWPMNDGKMAAADTGSALRFTAMGETALAS